MKRTLYAPDHDRLLKKIYEAEKWTRREGEVRTKRVKDAGWVLSIDDLNNRFVAKINRKGAI